MWVCRVGGWGGSLYLPLSLSVFCFCFCLNDRLFAIHINHTHMLPSSSCFPLPSVSSPSIHPRTQNPPKPHPSINTTPSLHPSTHSKSPPQPQSIHSSSASALCYPRTQNHPPTNPNSYTAPARRRPGRGRGRPALRDARLGGHAAARAGGPAKGGAAGGG